MCFFFISQGYQYYINDKDLVYIKLLPLIISFIILLLCFGLPLCCPILVLSIYYYLTLGFFPLASYHEVCVLNKSTVSFMFMQILLIFIILTFISLGLKCIGFMCYF